MPLYIAILAIVGAIVIGFLVGFWRCRALVEQFLDDHFFFRRLR